MISDSKVAPIKTKNPVAADPTQSRSNMLMTHPPCALSKR
jgi:hypothetical protein